MPNVELALLISRGMSAYFDVVDANHAVDSATSGPIRNYVQARAKLVSAKRTRTRIEAEMLRYLRLHPDCADEWQSLVDEAAQERLNLQLQEIWKSPG